jgi:CheY-like chemotaxis protein
LELVGLSRIWLLGHPHVKYLHIVIPAVLGAFTAPFLVTSASSAGEDSIGRPTAKYGDITTKHHTSIRDEEGKLVSKLPGPNLPCSSVRCERKQEAVLEPLEMRSSVMITKESNQTSAGRSDPRETDEMTRYAAGPERETQQSAGKVNPSIWLRPVNPVKPRILIVHDDDTIAKNLEIILQHAGLVSERVKSMNAACEYARSGCFQVVVTPPTLGDGSWNRLAEVDSRYRPGFVIILVATTFDPNEWGQALEDGAFDVLDALHELPNVAEAARRALWAAYLKGAGPRPETPSYVGIA